LIIYFKIVVKLFGLGKIAKEISKFGGLTNDTFPPRRLWLLPFFEDYYCRFQTVFF